MFEFGNRVAVKVCGVTNAADALLCAELGVEMLGLNFSPQSARSISFAQAAEIIAAVRPQFPATHFVGIFVDQEIEFVRKIATELRLEAVQLHGDETPEYLEELKGSFVIKALRVGPGHAVTSASDYKCNVILLDSWSTTSPGGTGETFPWTVAAVLRPEVGRLVLAGGLTSENVGRAIQMVQPWAVDVCSGVEDGPGRKDGAKVRRFVEAVRSIEEVKMAK